jgi:PAS domain S-box-containing protein
MAVTPSDNPHFAQLYKYIHFLLHERLQEATVENLRLARENKLPLLGLLSHLSEQALYTYFNHRLEKFLVSLLEGKVLDVTRETMQKWKKGELEGFPKAKVQVADVVLAYSIRKQVFIKFLGAFTQDTQQAISIALSLEKLFVKIEDLALHAYVEIQEEELKTLNHNLRELQEEQQAINEELRESQEELQAMNDELKEQVEIRQTTEEALEKERNYLEAILENISDGIVACNEQGVLSFFNKATRNFHGISEQALPPEEWGPYYSLYQPDEKTPLAKEEIPLFKAYRGEPVINVEMVIAPMQGQKRSLLASGRQIISSQGKSLGAVVVMHDITERKKAQKEQEEANRSLHEINQELATALEELQSTEEQLIEANNELELRVQARTDELAASEEELRQTLDKTIELNEVISENRNLLYTVANAAPVTLWMSGTQGEITYVNQTWIDWTGRPFQAHMGEGWALAIIPEDNARALKKYQAAFQAREFYQVDFRIKHPDGQIRWCVATGVPRYLANGDFAGYVGSCIDITERKLAEQGLKESEERARFLLEAMPQKVWTADAQGNADYLNEHWMNYTGRSFEELKAWGWSHIIHPDDLEENIRLWKHSIETGSTLEFEHRFRTKEGSYRWHLSRGIGLATKFRTIN